MNIKDLDKRPLPPQYTEDGSINLQWLYELTSSYEEKSLVGASLEWGCEENGQARILKDVLLEEAAINIFNYKGATIVQADLSPDKRPIFTQASNICKDWINFVPENRKEFVVLRLMPIIFECKLTIVFTDMVYYDAQFSGNNLRLIMVFNEEATEVYTDESIDFEKISSDAEREVNSELNRLEQENFALYKEIEEMEKSHMFEDKIKEDMKEIIDPTSKNMAENRDRTDEMNSNPFMRIRKDSKDEEGEEGEE